MPRPLPAHSGRVQGRLCRSRQLSGSSLILEVPWQNSASCAIKPTNAKTGNAGIAASPCRRPQTKVPVDALQNTFERDAMKAKILPKTLWRLVGSAIAAGIVGRRRSHPKVTASSFESDLRRDDGSMPATNWRPEVGKISGPAEPASKAGMGRLGDLHYIARSCRSRYLRPAPIFQLAGMSPVEYNRTRQHHPIELGRDSQRAQSYHSSCCPLP